MTTPGGAVVLAADELGRSFGETQALRDASFELTAGEVHALVGENGSGKSTLVKILSGVLGPDRGALRVGERTLRRLRSPREAQRLGIATVFQEILICPERPLLENVWLGSEGEFRSRRSKAEKERVAAAVVEELAGRPVDLERPVGQLELSDRQLCVIARALVRDPSVLILDEATSALDVADRDRVFAAVRRRCENGLAVVLITHKMDEIAVLADRATVLRSGETLATLSREKATTEELLRLMSGRETVAARAAARASETDAGLVRLSVTAAAGDQVLTLRAGEIVGLAGLEGHGQDRFLRALAGLSDLEGGGTVVVHPGGGKPRTVDSPHAAAAGGVAYVPRDRKAQGIFEPLSILDNFALPTLARYARGGLVRQRAQRAAFEQARERLDIRTGPLGDKITTLSGGNQQKVVIARWLALNPAVLVLNDPTRGVDLGTKHDVYALLEELARAGMAIVILSTEIEEHLALADRVMVFREGHVFTTLERDELSRHAVMAGLFGRPAEAAA